MSGSRQATGRQGEQAAAAYLQRQGYVIVQTNWRCSAGEIDIVAQQGDEWVFVEVRSRRRASTEAAFESISARKRERMICAVYAYLAAFDVPADAGWRVDVIAVALQPAGATIEHVENALDW